MIVINVFKNHRHNYPTLEMASPSPTIYNTHLETVAMIHLPLPTSQLQRTRINAKQAVCLVTYDGKEKGMTKSIFDDEYRVALRGENVSAFKNMIGLPGGVVEAEDSCSYPDCGCAVVHAAIRELREETGIIVTSSALNLLYLDVGMYGFDIWYFAVDIGIEYPFPMEMNARKLGSPWIQKKHIQRGDNEGWSAPQDHWMIPEVRLLKIRLQKVLDEFEYTTQDVFERLNTGSYILPFFAKPIIIWSCDTDLHDQGLTYDHTGMITTGDPEGIPRPLRNSVFRIDALPRRTSNIELDHYQDILWSFPDRIYYTQADANIIKDVLDGKWVAAGP